jgi:hypothetical protein
MMKKFAINAVAFAAGALCLGSAFAAGTISLGLGAATPFAVEAISGATTALVPFPFSYTMGVGRPNGNDFAIIVTPNGATFNGPPTCVIPTINAPAADVSISLKRSSATECAYDVHIINAAGIASGRVFTWTGQTFTNHSLNTVGSTLGITIKLKDPGETADVDNGPAGQTATVAQSVQAVNIYAPILDTFTIADVNAAGGPLRGFVAGSNGGPFGWPADAALQANTHVRLVNNPVIAATGTPAHYPDGVTHFDFRATGGTATVVLNGSNTGALRVCYDLNDNNGATATCDAGEVFTLGTNTATLTFPATAFPGVNASADHDIHFNADGATDLGTARSFSLAGTITPGATNPGFGYTQGAAHGISGSPSPFWTWSANASQLMTSYFTTNSIYLTRYFFLNTGASAVGYTATCYGETGNTITYGAARTGTLSANGTTAVDARQVCDFAGAKRGSVVFTINAPINVVKGTYQYIDQTTLNGVALPMVRPYNQANTTE